VCTLFPVATALCKIPFIASSISKVHFEFKIFITPPYLDLASPCCCVEVGRDDRSKRSQMSRRLMISGWMGRSSFLRNDRKINI
jgi:hypothetical protein